jgi:hypothetical protein
MRGFRQLEKADRSSVPWMLDYRSFAEAGGKPTGVDASSRPSVPLGSIFSYCTYAALNPTHLQGPGCDYDNTCYLLRE